MGRRDNKGKEKGWEGQGYHTPSYTLWRGAHASPRSRAKAWKDESWQAWEDTTPSFPAFDAGTYGAKGYADDKEARTDQPAGDYLSVFQAALNHARKAEQKVQRLEQARQRMTKQWKDYERSALEAFAREKQRFKQKMNKLTKDQQDAEHQQELARHGLRALHLEENAAPEGGDAPVAMQTEGVDAETARLFAECGEQAAPDWDGVLARAFQPPESGTHAEPGKHSSNGDYADQNRQVPKHPGQRIMEELRVPTSAAPPRQGIKEATMAAKTPTAPRTSIKERLQDKRQQALAEAAGSGRALTPFGLSHLAPPGGPPIAANSNFLDDDEDDDSAHELSPAEIAALTRGSAGYGDLWPRGSGCLVGFPDALVALLPLTNALQNDWGRMLRLDPSGFTPAVHGSVQIFPGAPWHAKPAPGWDVSGFPFAYCTLVNAL
ncbi:unnamed protein product [Symbiodinium sp. CCMP2592]|nr:unnamed protein product [Symbiodinium sp. CCMP2592]